MKKVLKSYLSYLLLISSLFASPYESLLLIEFDNLNKNKKYDDLRHYLPDLIKSNSSVNEYFKIDYAGKIEPYINSEINLLKTIVLVGEFNIEDEIISILIQ